MGLARSAADYCDILTQTRSAIAAAVGGANAVSAHRPLIRARWFISRRLVAQTGGASRLLGIFSARVAGAIIGLVSQILLARLLGPEELATYFLALGTAGVLAVVCALGVPSVTVQIVAGLRVQSDIGALGKFVASTRRSVAGTIAVVLGACATAVLTWPDLREGVRLSLLLGLAAVPPLVLLRLNGALANAFRNFNTSYLPDLLGRPMLALIAAIFMAMGLGSASAGTALWVHLAGVLVLAAIQYRFLMSVLKPASAWASSSQGTVEKSSPLHGWHWRALPLIPLALMVGLFGELQILLVSPFLAADELAVFGVSLKLALLLGFCIQVSHQLFLPDASEAHARGDTSALRRQVLSANRTAMILCVTGCIVLAMAGEFLLGLFGQGFETGYWCLIILSLSQLARAALGPGAQLLVMAQAETSALKASMASIILLAALNAFLANYAGIVGAAVAVALCVTMWSGWLAVLARRSTGIAGAGW